MADFLLEIGLEEVPARMIAAAEAELLRRVVGLLERERLLGDASQESGGEAAGILGYPGVSYSTPRRLAVLVRGVRARQEDVAEEVMGPAVKIAFPQGKDAAAGPAGIAFARKNGVALEDLKVVETAKGEYVAATSTKAGRTAGEVLAEGLPKELAGIYWAKNMYWRAGKPERFVRPVKWMVALLGEVVVPVSFAGVEAGQVSYGHRVLHGKAALEVTPETYVAALRGAFVEPKVETRREKIRKALDQVCRTVPGARWREDHELVDKMTHLTEWPSVILGGFEEAYLELPEEVLVTVMRDHQNYFAVERDGKLAPYFLAVLNTVTDTAGEAVIRHGNERVLRARFNDARFFWDFDRRTPLYMRVEMLEQVTFQKDLGSYAAKARRVEALGRTLLWTAGERGVKADRQALETAAQLAKTDLTTELVKEFTELQGIVGGLYARAESSPETVWRAIYDQYRPSSMEDRIPRTIEGQLLGLADRLDTLAGMFGLGLEPTGSKDPFALRRGGNGIVRILAEGGTGLLLREVCEATGAERGVLEKMQNFLRERVEFYLKEAKGQAYDVVKAVLASGGDDLPDAVLRAEAVTAARGGKDFEAVSAALKRMKGVVAQAWAEPVIPEEGQNWDDDGEPAEQENLQRKAMDVGLWAGKALQARDYGEALRLLATLRPEIDAFFEAVMVLVPNGAVRMHRVVMLEGILGTASRIADFGEIVVAG